MSLLHRRYRNDGINVLELNASQLSARKAVENKISSGEYRFEAVVCAVCEGADFRTLAEKDRYGLHVPTVICKTCGLLQTNPRMTQESYNDFYANHYRKLYDFHDANPEAFFAGQLKRGAAIIGYLEQYTGQSFSNKFVVEAGAGAGGILQAFMNRNNRVFGFDPGSELIEYGISKGIPLKAGGTEALKTLTEKPDLVIYSHVLEHLSNPGEHLRELRRHLKPFSLVYIEVPGLYGLRTEYGRDFLRYLQNAHLYHFTLKTLKNLMQKAGYQMLAGDEVVRALFRTGAENSSFQSDYDASLDFLMYLENERTKPSVWRRIQRVIHDALVWITRKTGTYKLAKKMYHSGR